MKTQDTKTKIKEHSSIKYQENKNKKLINLFNNLLSNKITKVNNKAKCSKKIKKMIFKFVLFWPLTPEHGTFPEVRFICPVTPHGKEWDFPLTEGIS